MSQLHTVNKSPLDRNALESAVNHATKGSAILMIEDGIYGALKGTIKSSVVTDAMGDISFYVLGPDLKARGLTDNQIIDGVKVVDYNGFVDLVAEHETTQSWL
jgi:tRNA 2-thiouridine synthesizing protein B